MVETIHLIVEPGQEVVITTKRTRSEVDDTFFNGDPKLIKPANPNERRALNRFRDLVAGNPIILMRGLEKSTSDTDELDLIITPASINDVRRGLLNERYAIELGTRILVEAGAEKELAQTALSNFYNRIVTSAENTD